MFKTTVVLLLLFFSIAIPAEQCEKKYLEELEYSDIECQFYLGTQAYRNKVYIVAAAHWQFVIDSEEKYQSDASFKVMASSTLNFLYYQGLGVEEDKEKAVSNWKKAVSKGDFEARRHLGFAYSDENYKNNDLVKALGWYESMFMVVENYDELDESDKNVFSDGMKDAQLLREKLSKKQIKDSLDFAKTTL